jgi:hypothetical protein
MAEPTMMDLMPFPATPQEMCMLLDLEEAAKNDGVFNEQGIAGSVYFPDVRAYEVPLSMRHAMKLGPDGEVVMRVRDERTG